MQFVKNLELPKQLPHPRALGPSGKNDYDPEFWEFFYQIRRYLEGISDDQLKQRYESIVQNMKALTSTDRDVIPIQSFLSSWYWFKKEHQTRFEFHLRRVPFTLAQPDLSKRPTDNAPIRPSSPNACNVLFRYGEKKWMTDFIESGQIRISAASEYEKYEGDVARQDIERSKTHFMPRSHVKITTEDGHVIKPLTDVTVTVHGMDYYLYCMSCDWDLALFDAFPNTDCCVIVRDPQEFSKRLSEAAKSLLRDWYFVDLPVEYFYPYELVHQQRIDNVLSKDFRFAYQREYRFAWATETQTAHGFINLDLGPLTDICELHDRPRSQGKHLP